jgi:hypothetical protein
MYHLPPIIEEKASNEMPSIVESNNSSYIITLKFGEIIPFIAKSIDIPLSINMPFICHCTIDAISTM